jgi:cyclase
MLKKRIIVCLDVKDGRTTKGVKFQNNIDIGDPVQMASEYYKQGVDELVFLRHNRFCKRTRANFGFNF